LTKTLVLCFGLLLCVHVSRASFAWNPPKTQSGSGYGVIQGQVVTSEGKPVPNAIVYSFEYGRLPLNVTDERGHFTLKDVPARKHWIVAYKESDGFPNPLWSFYSESHMMEGFPVVKVEANQTVRNVIVRLGPKLGRLVITVLSARTKQSIRDASVVLNHKGKPKTRFESGATNPDGTFDLLIPTDVAINVTVSAPGYKTWRYVNEKSTERDAIRVRSGSSRRVFVELQAIK
jgi:hypothetical protein